MKDKLNITIRIADRDPLELSATPGEEQYIREAEDGINRLWVTWKERYKVSPEKLMTMIAFRFAQLYMQQKAREKNAVDALKTFEKEILGLQRAIDGAADPRPSRDPAAPGPADHPSLL